jgi:hypothetical protein
MNLPAIPNLQPSSSCFINAAFFHRLCLLRSSIQKILRRIAMGCFCDGLWYIFHAACCVYRTWRSVHEECALHIMIKLWTYHDIILVQTLTMAILSRAAFLQLITDVVAFIAGIQQIIMTICRIRLSPLFWEIYIKAFYEHF